MPELKTVKVVNPDGEGFMIINADEFDPKQHTKWEQRKKKVSESNDSDPLLDRINELEALYQSEGWRSIADLSESLGIEKPDGGWRLAIPLIAQKELGQNEPNQSDTQQT